MQTQETEDVAILSKTPNAEGTVSPINIYFFWAVGHLLNIIQITVTLTNISAESLAVQVHQAIAFSIPVIQHLFRCSATPQFKRAVY